MVDSRWIDLANDSGVPVLVLYGMHREGDACKEFWKRGKAEPHAGRICSDDSSTLLGPFWTEDKYTNAWDAASAARFEHGESG